MIVVSATALRNDLFSYLDRVANGEIIVIKRNRCEIARLVASKTVDWREKMTIHPKIKVSENEIIEPLDEIWEEY